MWLLRGYNVVTTGVKMRDSPINMYNSRHAKLILTSNHDTKVPFGMNVPLGHRNIFIQRHTLYLKIQDGRRPPY